MPTFNGTLNANQVYSAIYNMIISQDVQAKNIAGTNSQLLNMSKVDAGMLGDSKLYYATQAIETTDWSGDQEAQNLLKLHRPASPNCQRLVIDKTRMVAVTTDNYLTKRAWGSEGSFATFNSVMKSWLGDSKRIFESGYYNTFIGTDETTIAGQTQTLTLPTDDNAEAQNRLQAEAIAEKIANIFVDLQDINRINDLQYVRSYDLNDIIVVWNSSVVNSITKKDLPMIFHNEGLVDRLSQYTLPARFFGTVNTTSGTTAASNTTVRALSEKKYGTVNCLPGDLLPANTEYNANETYTTNDKIICKIIHKNSVPYLTSWSVGTSFNNPRSLTDTNYVIWSYATLEHLSHLPFITLKKA